MHEFFVSYCGADRAWADWIAFQLESQGFAVIFQHKDFRASATVVGEIDRALGSARHTILVCSPAYFTTSQHTVAEYEAARNRELTDPTRACVPVKVDAQLGLHDVPPLLSGKIMTDLSAAGSDEAAALGSLLRAVSQVPEAPPAVPTMPQRPAPAFPGSSAAISVWDRLRSIKAHCQAYRQVRTVYQYVAMSVFVLFLIAWAIGLVLIKWLPAEQSLAWIVVSALGFMFSGLVFWQLDDCSQKLQGLMIAIDNRDLDDVRVILKALTCARRIGDRARTYANH